VSVFQPVTTAGSLRSTVSTGAALRGSSSGRTSPAAVSDTPSRRSAASRLVARSQLTSAAVRKMTKRQRLSASFTFLIACGLQLDHAGPLNGTDSAGRASLLTAGRHGNGNAPANGSANYTTSSSPVVTARRNPLQPRNDQRHFTDIRL